MPMKAIIIASYLCFTQERLSEETRAKINMSNKYKHLQDEAERLNQQLEDEEEAKTALQNKLSQITQQVCSYDIIVM